MKLCAIMGNRSELHSKSCLRGIIEQLNDDSLTAASKPVLFSRCFELIFRLFQNDFTRLPVIKFLAGTSPHFCRTQFERLFRAGGAWGAEDTLAYSARVSSRGMLLKCVAIQLHTQEAPTDLLGYVIREVQNPVAFVGLLPDGLFWQHEHEISLTIHDKATQKEIGDWHNEAFITKLNDLFRESTSIRCDFEIQWCDIQRLEQLIQHHLPTADYFQKLATSNKPNVTPAAIDCLRAEIRTAAWENNILRRSNAAKQVLVDGWCQTLETALYTVTHKRRLNYDACDRASFILSILVELVTHVIGPDTSTNMDKTPSRIPELLLVVSRTINHAVELLHSTCTSKDTEFKISDVLGQQQNCQQDDQKRPAGEKYKDLTDFEYVCHGIKDMACFEEMTFSGRENLYGAMLYLAQLAETSRSEDEAAVDSDQDTAHNIDRLRGAMDTSLFAVENSVYLLWCHIEWYLKHRTAAVSQTTLDTAGSPSDKRARHARHVHVGLGDSVQIGSGNQGGEEGAANHATQATGAAYSPIDLKHKLGYAEIAAFVREICEDETVAGVDPSSGKIFFLNHLRDLKLKDLEAAHACTLQRQHPDPTGAMDTTMWSNAAAVSDPFMDVVCRDAANDEFACVSLAALNTMIRFETKAETTDSYLGQRWLPFMEKKGWLAHYLAQVVAMKETLRDLLHSTGNRVPVLAPLNLLEARLAVLQRIAMSPNGVEILARGEALWILRQCEFISTTPICESSSTDPDEPDEWHRRMVIPLLKLGVTMLETQTSSTTKKDVVRQMLSFVAEHAEKYFRNVLSKYPLQHDRLTAAALEEFSLVSSLLRQLAEPDRTVLAAEVLGRAKSENLQRLMLSLLSGFADRDAVVAKVKIVVGGHLQDNMRFSDGGGQQSTAFVRRLCPPIRPRLWPIMNNHITVGS